MWRLKALVDVFVAMLPSWVKIPIYRRFYGYHIGRRVHIGLSPFLSVGKLWIGDDVRIGSLNAFVRLGELTIGAHTRIGFLNLFRGGRRVVLGGYVSILRQNVFNAIIDGDFLEPVAATLELGTGVAIASAHWLDFSQQIAIGAHSIIGGRNSSFWTHNRQRARAITVGHHCYLASDIKVAPGAEVPPLSIVALGSVLVGRLQPEQSLIGGNPATVLRPLDQRDLYLVCRKTRTDMPDDIAREGLPQRLREFVHCLPPPAAKGNGDDTHTEPVV